MTQDETLEREVIGNMDQPEIFRFREALSFVLKWEREPGVSDDPDDRGGRTNDGITQSEYDLFRKRVGQPPRDVANISEDELEAIYWHSYWLPSGATHALAPLDLALFDTGVNMGVETAIRLFQRAAGALTVDGVIGPKTKAALQAGPLALTLDRMLDYREERYGRIVTRAPSQRKFLKGWMNRLDDLRRVCKGAMNT